MDSGTRTASLMASAGVARAAAPSGAVSPVWPIQGGLCGTGYGHVATTSPATARFAKNPTARRPEEALT